MSIGVPYRCISIFIEEKIGFWMFQVGFLVPNFIISKLIQAEDTIKQI